MVITQATAETLKTALENRNFSSFNTIEDLRSWYWGGDVFTYIGTGLGRVKAVSDSTKPRLFEQSENVVRAWADPELASFLIQNVQYVNHTFSTVNGGLSRRCTLTVTDGQTETEFTADQLIGSLTQEQADLEAFALAIIELLDDEDFDTYRN